MTRLGVIKNNAPHATPAIDVHRYRDAALILRADGEGVPRRSDFGYGWDLRLCGTVAIEGAAENLAVLANRPDANLIVSYRANKLAEALMRSVTELE